MTIYTSGTIGAQNATVEDFPSSFGESITATAEEGLSNNVSTLLYNAYDLHLKNQGKSFLEDTFGGMPGMPGVGQVSNVSKLDKASAEQKAKDAGVKIDVPDDGYSQDALDSVIERQKNQRVINDTLARAPSGPIAGGARFATSLAVGLLDPLNVAAAFIPVVGEARYAELLANAGSALGRAGVRAGVGAVEGAVGMAALEPATYAAHKYLNDDYTMANSLENIAFGAAFGGGLHMASGSIGEAIRNYRGINQPWDIKAPETKIEQPQTEFQQSAQPAQIPFSDEAVNLSRQIDEGKLSAEQFKKITEQNPLLAKEIVQSRLGEPGAADKITEAPFAKKAELESFKAQAVSETLPEIKAQLIAESGGLADKGIIGNLKAERDAAVNDLRKLMDNPEQAMKSIAKEQQATGLSRKQAEKSARDIYQNQTADAQSKVQRLNDQVDKNSTAAKSAQDLAAIEKGQIPDRFKQQIEERAQQLANKQALQDAISLPSQHSARWVIGQVDPSLRRSALSASIAHMMQGRMPDVEALVRMDPKNPNAMAAVVDAAKRIASPDSLDVGDAKASQAATERLNSAPKEHGVAEAEQSLSKAMDDLKALQKNLEQAGLSAPDIEAELKPWNDLLSEADALGEAVRAAAICGMR